MGNMLQKICGITEHKMAIKDIRIHIDGFDLDEVFGDVPFDDLVAFRRGIGSTLVCEPLVKRGEKVWISLAYRDGLLYTITEENIKCEDSNNQRIVTQIKQFPAKDSYIAFDKHVDAGRSLRVFANYTENGGKIAILDGREEYVFKNCDVICQNKDRAAVLEILHRKVRAESILFDPLAYNSNHS